MKLNILPIVLVLLVFLSANSYVFYRIWHMMPPTMVGRVLFVLLAVFVTAAPFLAMGLGGSMPTLLSSLLYKVGTSWLIIFLYLLMIFVVLDLLRLTHILPAAYLHANWKSLGVMALALTALFGWGYYRYTHKVRVELPLTVNKVMAGDKPLKIVLVSDLHLGYGIGRAELESWVKLINEEHPDILLIGGDITDNKVRPLLEQRMAEAFKEVKTTYGIYTVLGNHEYIGGASEASAFLRQAGIHLLKDSAVLIDDRFYVVGRDDCSNHDRKPLADLLINVDKAKPIILLDHQPYGLEEAQQNGIDFQFSGHTHQGQVWPASLLTNQLFEKAHGYLQKGNTHIYVSSGLGIWGGKFRIGTQSEYVVVELSHSK